MLKGIIIPLLFVAICTRFLPHTIQTKINSMNFTVSHLRRQTQHLLKTPTECSLSITTFLLLSGDIEVNPGPRQIYLCALCDLEVTWSCQAICCDECNIWIHRACVDMNTLDYSLVGKPHVSWLCPRCDSNNCDTFTFNSFEISCHNSFAPLASESQTGSVHTISTSDPFSPRHTSSPKTNPSKSFRSSIPSDISHRHSSQNSSVYKLPCKTNLRVANINCQSVRNKSTELQTALSYIKPDLVCGTESWLEGVKPGKPPTTGPNSVLSSEIFPEDYNVFRNDRNLKGGGVFILAHKSLTVEEQPDLNSNCEINWIKVKLENTADLYFGSFYMPHRNESDINELSLSLNKLNSKGSGDPHIVLAGDFNCPDVNWDDHIVDQSAQDRSLQQKLADIASHASLSQVHAQPTRQSATLDLIFTSNPSLLKNSTSVPGISDHSIVVSDFDTRPQVTKSKDRKKFKFHKANWTEINKDLLSSYCEIEKQYNENKSADVLWSSFKDKLFDSMKKHIPQGTTKKRNRLPWINKSIKRLLRKKQKLFQKAKESKNWDEYRKHQKHCKREIRRAEWKYINNTIQDGLQNNNSKPFWNFIKSRRKDNIGISPLREKGKLFSDPENKARILLNQFKSVFTPRDMTNTMKPPTQAYPNCPPITIDTAGVAKLLQKLQPHKAPGPDSIPNTILINCADAIAPIMTLVFQRSIDSGNLPKDWLTANISSAYKKGDRHSAENYRPISLTSVSCKLLEHIICRHLLSHFENNCILTSLNHGFRAGYSCETQLLTTANDLLTSFDRNKQVDIAILDFSKAFDTVPHNKLLYKLEKYGITGSTLTWLKTFLTQRTMRVVLDGVASEPTTVDSGVPQGTVLGPILFLCHINDLPSTVSSQVRLFADDCLLYREINTFKDHLSLQKDLKSLEEWADTWGMRFNATKCYILSTRNKSSYHYQLNNVILKQVQNNPYLGVLFSEDLKWTDHITKITKKANSTLGFLRRNLKYCPTKCKRAAYLSMVRSVLEYGATLWDPYLQKEINMLEQVQRKALRFIAGDFKTFQTGTIKRLHGKLNIPTLQERRKSI